MTGSQSEPNRTVSWYFWAIGGLAVLWNGFGTYLWGGTSFMPDTFLDGFPAAHREYISGLPGWSTLTWGIGVIGGLIGSIMLLMRTCWAVQSLAASLLAAATNPMVYVTNPPPAGFFNLPLTVFIVGFAIFLLWFALMMKRRGVLS